MAYSYIAYSQWANIKSKLPDNPTPAQLREFLGTEVRRKLASNVMVHDSNGNIVISIFEHDIIMYLPDGSARVSHRGYKTQTTRARINQFGPKGINISPERKGWTLSDGDKDVLMSGDGWYAITAEGKISL